MIKRPYLSIFIVLVAIAVFLQYQLWNSDDGIKAVERLTEQIAEQRAENETLLERNLVLEAEIIELKKGLETVEERARQELGMIKDDETLYLILP
ncbi:septum formation initiator family protein [Thiopseudomonas alkaliphila]|uniref:septum formation initiator family protein n=1 Tax=Thiopseudomonas alkaliphila TaxID=1697053 RepID=UPI002576FADA|nr:septum formation initiator family protein [Thiopseudomonas alkaliphila]